MQFGHALPEQDSRYSSETYYPKSVVGDEFHQILGQTHGRMGFMKLALHSELNAIRQRVKGPDDFDVSDADNIYTVNHFNAFLDLVKKIDFDQPYWPERLKQVDTSFINEESVRDCADNSLSALIQTLPALERYINDHAAPAALASPADEDTLGGASHD